MKARIVALVTATWAATWLWGCASNTQSLVILQNDVPDVTSGVCTAPAGLSTLFRSAGTLDISFFGSYSGSPLPTAGYLLFPALQNNLSSTVAGTPTGVADSAFNIELTRVDVELVDAGAQNRKLTSAPFSVPVYKVMKAGDTVALAVDVIPASVIGSLYDGQLVMAKVTAVGNRDGGEIRSNTMSYAISICDGCLFDDVGACVDFTGTGTANQCNVAQDEVAVCCEHSTLGLICPAVTETPPSG